MAATITRRYETFAVLFARGTRVSGFDTRDEAERYLGAQAGEVERRTFDVTIDAARAHLYQPGIGSVHACGCVTVNDGPGEAHVDYCDRHMPAWKRPGFTPAAPAARAVSFDDSLLGLRDALCG